jgi:Zn-dependent protease
MFEQSDIRHLAVMALPILSALTVHEYAHALAANALGDDTAKNAGRLTLNPLPHLDLLGTLILFLSQLVGWAKPVPINPGNFKNPARDISLVALAGPVMNFLAALLLTLGFKLLYSLNFFSLFPSGLNEDMALIIALTIFINISLGVFNLLPLPPLDGFKAISFFLPPRWIFLSNRYNTALFFVLLFLSVTGLLSGLVRPPINFIFQLIAG